MGNEDRTQIHKNLCVDLHKLYIEKNNDYGDSFRRTRELFPDSICIRLSDKLNRIIQLTKHPESQKVNESIEDTLMDLANYALLELTERKFDQSIQRGNND